MMTPEPLTPLEENAEVYPALLQLVARQVKTPAPRKRGRIREPSVFSERLLQCIWYDGHFHADALKTACGKTVEIKSPGRWNGEAGPDFLKADLVIDGRPVSGDVEMHLRATDWKRHGHAPDPNYSGVVLHAVLDIDDGNTVDTLPSGREIPRVELRPLLHGNLDVVEQALGADDIPFHSEAMVGRCHRIMGKLGQDPQVTAFFDAAAARRIRAKTERLKSQIGDDADFEQVFYQALMTAMGHRGSKTLFFLLAKRVPLRELESLTKPWKGEKRALAIQALLLHVANLMASRPEGKEWDDETMRHVDALNRVWAELGGHFSDRIIPVTTKWRSGMRPASFPERRLAGIAHLLANEWNTGGQLFAALVERCIAFAAQGESNEKQVRKQIKDLTAALAFDGEDHWAHRYTLGGKVTAKPQRLIGESRARSVLFNAFLPLVLIHARREKNRPLLDWAQAFAMHFPALEENTVTKFMKYRLLGTPDAPRSLFRTEMRQQALFHVFTDCCNHVTTSCEQCAFFARLKG